MCSCPITNNSLFSVPLLLILDYLASLVVASLLARAAAAGDTASLLVPSLSGGGIVDVGSRAFLLLLGAAWWMDHGLHAHCGGGLFVVSSIITWLPGVMVDDI